MILHDYVLSASCYKVRLMAALLDRDLTLRAVNFHPAREQAGDFISGIGPVAEAQHGYTIRGNGIDYRHHIPGFQFIGNGCGANL